MPAVDAIGASVHRLDVEVLRVYVDVIGGIGGLLARDSISGFGSVVANGSGGRSQLVSIGVQN